MFIKKISYLFLTVGYMSRLKNALLGWGKKRLVRILLSIALSIVLLLTFEVFSKSSFYKTEQYPNLSSIVFVIVVVLAALRGGMLAAYICAIITLVYAFYFFSYPSQLGFVLSNKYRLSVLAIALPLIATVVGYLREQSERFLEGERKARREAEVTRQKYGDLVNALDAIVWEAEPNNLVFSFISKKAKDVLGYSLKRWLTEPSFLIHHVHREDQEKVISFFTHFSEEPKQKQIDYRMIAKDGRTLWLRNIASMVRDSTGDRFIRGIMIDITTQKKLDDRKDEFLSVASHELKTPLTTIKAFLQLLERHAEEETDKKTLRYVHKVSMQTDKLTSLIYDLLDVSKIQAGKMEINKEVFDYDSMIEEVLENVQEATKKHYIIRQGRAKKKVFADRMRIEQVLTNLLSNAVKYSPNSDKVMVLISTTDQRITTSIQDFGIGIPKSQHAKIFDRFYSMSNKHKESFPGFGLGLYISREIVRRHGGRLGVESNAGNGTTFYFTLPIYDKTS